MSVFGVIAVLISRIKFECKNVDQNNSEYGHFSRSVYRWIWTNFTWQSGDLICCFKEEFARKSFKSKFFFRRFKICVKSIKYLNWHIQIWKYKGFYWDWTAKRYGPKKKEQDQDGKYIWKMIINDSKIKGVY